MKTNRRIDLNSDVAEGFSADKDILGLVSSANVCCGSHAGSIELSLYTVKLCQDLGVTVGAHPGIPDRETMGRGPVPELNERMTGQYLSSLCEQVEVLAKAGAKYIKPHGWLYNASATRMDVCIILVGLLTSFRLPLLGLPSTLHVDAAASARVPFFSEGFADRAYDSSGTLVPRGEAGAVLTDPQEATFQALSLAGTVDSICVHGDTPDCLDILRTVKLWLGRRDYLVKSCV
ncbi:MAG: LamB/YcsF family protein [Armatimonadetes bacterium]|nr:LamB/YcsF family protein [Armatimonadota bacterium]